MRILIVNFFYYPSAEAHSFRWQQLAEYWAKKDMQVEVITMGYEGLPKYKIEKNVHITRVGFPKWKSLKYESDSIAIKQKNIFYNFLRQLYSSLRWPDSFWFWLPFSVMEVLKRLNYKYDLIISYYPSFTAHLTVFFMKLFSRNNSFKWILDYGDPFSTSESIQPNNFYLYRNLNTSLEKLFSRYGQIVFYNDLLVNDYIEKLSLSKNNIPKKIEPLVNLEEFYNDKIKSNCIKDHKKVILNYIGKFYVLFREPYILFEIISKLNGISEFLIELDIYGPTGGFDLEQKDNNFINYRGMLDRNKAIKITKESSFLINIENTNCIQSPSKTIELIATGIPIINISNPNNPDYLLRDYEKIGGCICISRENINEKSLKKLIEFIKIKNIENNIRKEDLIKLLKNNLIKNISKKYLDLLSN